LCFVSDFFVSFKNVDHGGCWGNITRALAQWWHLVASDEAMDALHQTMHPTLHRRICMAIKIASI
jgi:hypothetical protein